MSFSLLPAQFKARNLSVLVTFQRRFAGKPNCRRQGRRPGHGRLQLARPQEDPPAGDRRPRHPDLRWEGTQGTVAETIMSQLKSYGKCFDGRIVGWMPILWRIFLRKPVVRNNFSINRFSRNVFSLSRFFHKSFLNFVIKWEHIVDTCRWLWHYHSYWSHLLLCSWVLLWSDSFY